MATAVEVVGVMPPGVDFPRGAELWVPVVPFLARARRPTTTALDSFGVFYVIGRVRPGPCRCAAVRDEVNAIEARLDRATPGRLKWGTAPRWSRRSSTTCSDRVRPALRVLWVAVGVLLLIACANVSGLLLTRVARRRHEHERPVGAGRQPARHRPIVG